MKKSIKDLGDKIDAKDKEKAEAEIKDLKEALDKNILCCYKGKVKLLVSELKESDAAILGASALAWEL